MKLHAIGKSPHRPEGRAKVTGRADYAADRVPEGLAHAAGVFSTTARGTVARLDSSAAERSPGVIAVLHHRNCPRLFRCAKDFGGDSKIGEARPLFEDETISYAGQFVALVVAETFEQARTAARLVRVRIHEPSRPPVLTLDDGLKANGAHKDDDTEDEKRGRPDRAYEKAAFRVDATYTTPAEVHNPMELHATVASWADGRLVVHDSTQWVVGQRLALARMFGLGEEQVRVHAPFVGGGFGGKLFLWPHTQAAAMAARAVGRPVKLVIERKSSFTTVGHRPATRQRIRLGARRDGTLVSVRHETLAHTSMVDDFLEECGEMTKSMYRAPHRRVTHRLVPVNVGTPTPMRAPGAAPGSFALESAIDELAEAAGVDPVRLRLKSLARRDDADGKPWSSDYIRECFSLAARQFGWRRRTAEPGSMRDGAEIIGWGVAAASWSAYRGKAKVRVELRSDGTARVVCATQDIGTGTYSVVAQVASEVLGLPLERVEVALGNSDFPRGPISGGSMVTATVVPAVAAAVRKAIENLREAAVEDGAPFEGQEAEDLEWRDGSLLRNGKRATLEEILAATRYGSVQGEAESSAGEERKRYSFRSAGAQFVEVRWDPGIARLRVSRVVGVFDAGRIINRKTAVNQIHGSIMMGIGMTLLEEVVRDWRSGRVVNDNLSDYLMPVHADTPQIDVSFLDVADPHIGEFGAKGLGEVGITGLCAAIANAIKHATGRRLRELPIRIESLLGSTGGTKGRKESPG